MKKLLIVGLSVAMGTALALGITACGKKGNSDADTAKEAIKTVTNLHASVGTETPTSYKVTGATRRRLTRACIWRAVIKACRRI